GPRLAQLAEGLFEHLAGPRVLVLRCQQVTQGSGGKSRAQRVPCLPVQREALLEQRLCPGLVPAGDEREASSAQRQGTLIWRHAFAAGQDPFLIATQLLGVAAQPPEPPGRPAQVNPPFELAG